MVVVIAPVGSASEIELGFLRIRDYQKRGRKHGKI